MRAAAYCGVTPKVFEQMIADGLMPGPSKFYHLQRWDRCAIDKALSEIFDNGINEMEKSCTSYRPE
ncbi:hypothetical protein A6X20_11405 [Bradyrhizobium elkanii]|nr:hypothetical protein A6452_37835 [Bradyrhizobium elkanii]ODM85810.1 hypothetical protein A6X20_11405 [Bradyrhizobium elkanii]